MAIIVLHKSICFQIIPDSNDMIQHLLNNNIQYDFKISFFSSHTWWGIQLGYSSLMHANLDYINTFIVIDIPTGTDQYTVAACVWFYK